MKGGGGGNRVGSSYRLLEPPSLQAGRAAQDRFSTQQTAGPPRLSNSYSATGDAKYGDTVGVGGRYGNLTSSDTTGAGGRYGRYGDSSSSTGGYAAATESRYGLDTASHRAAAAAGGGATGTGYGGTAPDTNSRYGDPAAYRDRGSERAADRYGGDSLRNHRNSPSSLDRDRDRGDSYLGENRWQHKDKDSHSRTTDRHKRENGGGAHRKDRKHKDRDKEELAEDEDESKRIKASQNPAKPAKKKKRKNPINVNLSGTRYDVGK